MSTRRKIQGNFQLCLNIQIILLSSFFSCGVKTFLEEKTQTMKRFAIVKDLWARIYTFFGVEIKWILWVWWGCGKVSHQSIFHGAFSFKDYEINNSIFPKILFALRNEIIHHGAFMWFHYFLDFLAFYHFYQKTKPSYDFIVWKVFFWIWVMLIQSDRKCFKIYFAMGVELTWKMIKFVKIGKQGYRTLY